METSLKLQQTLIVLPSPNTSTTSSTSSNGPHNQPPTTPPQQTTTPPPQQQPVTRPEPNNPYPTTFVQADTSSFKQVVQMLTGSSDTAKRVDPHKNPIPPIKTNPKNNSSSSSKSSKLYERRNSLKSFKISPLLPSFASHPGRVGSPRMPGKPEILSPSMLNFPSLALSPVTPLIPDPFNRSPPGCGPIDMEAENKAIGNKGFYLHPSPSNTPRNGSEPRLLPLFPVTSPRVAAGSSNS